MGRYRFTASERLKHKKAIDALFAQGRMLKQYPFRVFYLPAPEGVSVHQTLFAVARRNIKKAVHRNTVKRRAREAYRLHKYMLAHAPIWRLGYLYVARQPLPYRDIRQAVCRSMERLNALSEKRDPADGE